MMHTLCKYADEKIEVLKTVVERGAPHFYKIAREGRIENNNFEKNI